MSGATAEIEVSPAADDVTVCYSLQIF